MKVSRGSSVVISAALVFAAATKVLSGMYADELSDVQEPDHMQIADNRSGNLSASDAHKTDQTNYRNLITTLFDNMGTTEEERAVADTAKRYLIISIGKTYNNYAVILPPNTLEKVAYERLQELIADPEVTDPLDYAEMAFMAASRSLDPYTRFPDEPFEQANNTSQNGSNDSVVSSRAYEGVVGYLKLTEFSEGSHTLFNVAGTQLVTELGGSDIGYIIDLRNNPGGGVFQARQIADDALENGVIYDVYSRGVLSPPVRATAGDIFNGKPIIVLMNRGSASASEILAGALQQNRRAIVMGEESFGKGVIQTIKPHLRSHPEDDSSNVHYRITTGFYRVGATRYGVHHNGIIPNILAYEVGGRTDRERDRDHSLAQPVLFNSSTRPTPSSICVNVDMSTIQTPDRSALAAEFSAMDRTLECALEAFGLDRPFVDIVPYPEERPDIQTAADEFAIDR